MNFLQASGSINAARAVFIKGIQQSPCKLILEVLILYFWLICYIPLINYSVCIFIICGSDINSGADCMHVVRCYASVLSNSTGGILLSNPCINCGAFLNFPDGWKYSKYCVLNIELCYTSKFWIFFYLHHIVIIAEYMIA